MAHYVHSLQMLLLALRDHTGIQTWPVLKPLLLRFTGWPHRMLVCCAVAELLLLTWVFESTQPALLGQPGLHGV